ncbi:uncharacterized protein F4822DRAFT_88805 [Hypoxylon trugodes]|uniref:uncharacterized protein n=1 Tax=Hypoxylon trugodes TaxID=326681 RepID=UPI0021906578|nr:uncharacterized protein F4822DRAFT_88805 [Hypoxylon trugodes]KAI1382984.1 hypothetical protein F4822DRAFT_88805 [Hypoxylon trugodes]
MALYVVPDPITTGLAFSNGHDIAPYRQTHFPAKKSMGSKPTRPVPILQEAELSAIRAEKRVQAFWQRVRYLGPRPPMPTTHRTVYLTTAEENPTWLQNRQANMRNSHLHQLPDECLLRIRDYLDGPTRQVARRTSSLFLRLIADLDLVQHMNQKDTKSPHFTLPLPWMFNRGRQIWPLHGTCMERISQSKLVTPLLSRDTGRLCIPCRAWKDTELLDYMLNWLKKPTWCSGCKKNHPLIFFSAAQRATSSTKRICIGREASIKLCSHEALTWADLEKASAKFGGLKGDERIRIEKKCMHRSHRSTRNKAGSLDLPEIAISSTRIISLHWRSPAFDLDPTVPVTKDQIRNYLASRKSIFEHALCPHVKLDDGQLLLPFEQNQCACFDGPQAVGHVPAHLHRHKSWEKCCRCRAANKPHLQGQFLPPETGAGNTLYWGDSLCHTYECSECRAEYSWFRDDTCRVYLRAHRHPFGRTPTSKTWLTHLDPESWGITEDEKLKHVVWCPDSKCATRSRWSRLLRLLLANADAL